MKHLLILISFILHATIAHAQQMSMSGMSLRSYESGKLLSNTTSHTTELANTLFKKTYSNSSGQNPGHLTGNFLASNPDYFLCSIKLTENQSCPEANKVFYDHKGLDFRAKVPYHKVYSPLHGRIIAAGQFRDISGTAPLFQYGAVVVYNEEFDLSFNFQHLSAIDVSVGDIVQVGTLIGTSGATSPVKVGPHLHVGLRIGKQYGDGGLNKVPTTNYDPRLILQFFGYANNNLLKIAINNLENKLGVGRFAKSLGAWSNSHYYQTYTDSSNNNYRKIIIGGHAASMYSPRPQFFVYVETRQGKLLQLMTVGNGESQSKVFNLNNPELGINGQQLNWEGYLRKYGYGIRTYQF